MGNARHDFFNPVSHIDHAGALSGQLFQRFQETFARGDIQPGAGFIQDQQFRTVNHSPSQQNPSCFSIRHLPKRGVAQGFNSEMGHGIEC